MKNAFEVKTPDFGISPYTGMTRKHYIECAKYVLERAFRHVESFDKPIVFPTVPGKTYPQPNDPTWRYRSSEFEALIRTLSLAAPLMHIEPEIAIHGINLKEYYCHHIYDALTPGHSNSLPLPEDLPDATYQFTCEFGGLCKFLLLMPDIIWPYFSLEQKNEIAITISKWAHHRTTQNNWRIFNIEMLSFLKKNGYDIDDDLLKSHLLWVASYHAGGGWYLEQSYNYYTISLFIAYGTVWCRAFGDEHYPEIARTLEKSAHELMKTYSNFFARNGFINMWARSICYRLWISGGFPIAFMLKPSSPLDPGWARRLCSGSLLQFVTREDFYENDIPSLGFYEHREYMLQSYSCSASPFIMFMPFLSLALPEDSPFWTAKENEGIWESIGSVSIRTVLEKPGIVLVNHGKTGTSEIVPGKVYDDDHNYSKLSFNTHFPWEDHNLDGGTAMEYCFRSLDPRDTRGTDVNFYLTGLTIKNDSQRNAKFVTSQSILFGGVRKDVLYRQLIMRKPPNNGVGYIIDLAEITIPGGVIRVDRCRLAFEHELTLGHYGLPHIDGKRPVIHQFEDKTKKVITASIQGRSLALMTYRGWDTLGSFTHKDCNAESAESTVIYTYRKRTTKNPSIELMITVMLHKTNDSEWSEEELSPIRNIEISDVMLSGSVLGAKIILSDGRNYEIDFECIDGLRSC
ncbi:MAG: DUF2264 domain-containing protein [Bacteroidota bacterium]